MKLIINFMHTGYIKMELRDLVKIFEEKQFETWVCPIIKCFCDHKCYGYVPKGFTLLISSETMNRSYWGQRFEKSEDIMSWGKSLETKVKVVNYMIHSPYCKIIDALVNLPNCIEGLVCRNG